MAAKKAAKAPGRNVKEAERNTVALKVRLSPETHEDLTGLAESLGVTKSKLVDAAFEALWRAKLDLEKSTGADVFRAFQEAARRNDG